MGEPFGRYGLAGDSATNLQRNAFQKLQAAIFAGQVETVVVWKLDRLARNLKEGVNVLADWLQARRSRCRRHSADRP